MSWKSRVLLAAAAMATGIVFAGAPGAEMVYRHKLPQPLSVAPDPADPQVDTVPDAFAIPSVLGAALSTFIQSAPITPTGFTHPAAVSVSGAPGSAVSVNGGSWVSSAIVEPGQWLRVGFVSSASTSAILSATLDIGGVSAVFSVTTRDLDTTPDAFTIAAVTAAERASVVESADVVPAGYSDPAPVSVSGAGTPEVSVAGGAWTTSATIEPGQAFRVRLTAAEAAATTSVATVTIGSVSAEFAVTSKTCAVGTQAFTYTGNIQPFTVPDGCRKLDVYAWGAGGGNSYAPPGNYSAVGGAGGFAQGTFIVASHQSLGIIVGGAGASGVANAPGGWPNGGNGGPRTDQRGAGGGGMSAVKTGDDYMLVAGAGGGAGVGNHYQGMHGGAGGGEVGQDGMQTNPEWVNGSGTGGSQSAGGNYGGGPLQGGYNPDGNSTGGGGGWHGGGAGRTHTGGGGGSGYINPAFGTGSLLAGNRGTPGGTGVAHYQAGTAGPAQHGRVVLSWQ